MSKARMSEYFIQEYFPMHKKCTLESFKVELFSNLPNLFNYNFSNKDLLLEAITHKSFAHETDFNLLDNERLEFLGDAVLDLVVADKTFKMFKDIPEGMLSKLRSTLVNEEILSHIALTNKIDMVILLGKGEVKNKGFEKKSVLSDCFEALVGAIYLDSDFAKVKEIVENIFLNYEEKIKVKLFDLDVLNASDPKSALQEITMKEYQLIPKYEAIEEIINKSKQFKVSIKLGDQILLTETNISKKKAMQNLAAKVLKEKLYNRAQA
jgi:ribonuclease-3